MRKRRLVLTMGDPAGIGPEIIIKALSGRASRLADLVVAGDADTLSKACAIVGTRLEAVFTHVGPRLPGAGQSGGHLPGPVLLQCETAGRARITFGRWSKTTGTMSLSCIEQAAKLVTGGQADGMVTAPICKEAVYAAGCAHPGHTELLAHLTSTDHVVMMLAGGGLRVALATIHIPLSQVEPLLSVEYLSRTIGIVITDLRRSFGLKTPRLAVLGLNPHAGEGGHMGTAEQLVIAPAIARAARAGFEATGPIPADTAFYRAIRGEFDAVLAMYHDQGLGPLKTVAFETGVNITLGLPIVRTSVDHGTGFDIAGTGQAGERSLIEAIRTAAAMCRARARADAQAG